jgi:hypothetical protein
MLNIERIGKQEKTENSLHLNHWIENMRKAEMFSLDRLGFMNFMLL